MSFNSVKHTCNHALLFVVIVNRSNELNITFGYLVLWKMPLILKHISIFQNVFHGPLHIFGKLFYEQMVTNGHHGHDKVKDRISCEQFVKAGKEVLKLFSDADQHKYYFKLFSQGKDHLTREGIMAF